MYGLCGCKISLKSWKINLIFDKNNVGERLEKMFLDFDSL